MWLWEICPIYADNKIVIPPLSMSVWQGQDANYIARHIMSQSNWTRLYISIDPISVHRTCTFFKMASNLWLTVAAAPTFISIVLLLSHPLFHLLPVPFHSISALCFTVLLSYTWEQQFALRLGAGLGQRNYQPSCWHDREGRVQRWRWEQ